MLGNRRFIANETAADPLSSQARRAALVAGQEPFAIVLGCSDSRVPAELVFDQGLGDLFVIRVAGNIVAPSQVGSVEFAAERFGTRLAVVLGHTQCGAVAATDEQASRRDAEYSQAQRMLVSDSPVAFLAQSVTWYLVEPYVKGLVATSIDEWPGELFPDRIYIAGH